jgi:hypothetical protein
MVQGKQRGRPRLEPGIAKRGSFNTRLRPALKLALETAAKQEGRSLSEEIESRLERSLDDERHLVDALELGFGRQEAGLMLAIGYVIRDTVPARRPGEIGWLANPEAFQVVVESINLLLQIIDPGTHPEGWATLRRAVHHGDGSDAVLITSVVAMVIADSLFDKDQDSNIGALIPTIRSWLGEAAVTRLRDRLALRVDD